MKRTPIPWLHVFAPLIGALTFLWYYSAAGNDNSLGKIIGFMEVLCMAFPLLIGILCGLVAAQEEQAGNYQVILAEARSRAAAYMSKLLLLLTLSALSVTFAVAMFSIDLHDVPLWLYVQIALAAWGGNVFLYILHLFAGFRFGRGASIGLGVFGTLISPLMMTGLGDGIWHWFPWAWSVRLCGNIVFRLQTPSQTAWVAADMQYGITVCIVLTLLSLAASLVWFQYWEGSKSIE
jgi:ABC-2 type transport system permease protein